MTPHDPIDPADPESMCKPDCARCAELVEDEEDVMMEGPFGAGYTGSLGPEDVSGHAEAIRLGREIDEIQRFLDRKFPGWRPLRS